MSSKLAILIPLISLLYMLQTLFWKHLKGYVKLPLALVTLGVLVFDVFVYLMFSVNCVEMGLRYESRLDCIRWMYPTVDFAIMLVVSLLILVAALMGVVKGWSKTTYYILGSVVLILGVASRLFVLLSATEAISLSNGSSSFLIFEIFSVLIFYGLVSSAIYLLILLLGVFTARIPR